MINVFIQIMSREKFDSKYKGTLKSNPESEKRQKTSYEQQKQNNLPTNF